MYFVPRPCDRSHIFLCVWAGQLGKATVALENPSDSKPPQLADWKLNYTSTLRSVVLADLATRGNHAQIRSPDRKLLPYHIWNVNDITLK